MSDGTIEKLAAVSGCTVVAEGEIGCCVRVFAVSCKQYNEPSTIPFNQTCLGSIILALTIDYYMPRTTSRRLSDEILDAPIVRAIMNETPNPIRSEVRYQDLISKRDNLGNDVSTCV